MSKSNIFTRSIDFVDAPNLNTFDRSFTNNLTLKFGELTPCFCKEVLPRQSVRIKPTFGFNMQPFVFPVQTKMRCNLHFFYVRNRPLWRGWMDFFGQTDNPDNDTTPPFIEFENIHNKLRAGSLFDNIGIPCTVTYPDDKYYDMFFYSSALGSPTGTRGFYGFSRVPDSSFVYSDSSFRSVLMGTRYPVSNSSLFNVLAYVYKLDYAYNYDGEVIDRKVNSITLTLTDFQDMLGNTIIVAGGAVESNSFDFVIGNQTSVLFNSTITVDANNNVLIDIHKSNDYVEIIYDDVIPTNVKSIIINEPLISSYFLVSGRSYYYSSTELSIDSQNEMFSLPNVQQSVRGTYDLADIPLDQIPYYMESSNPDGIRVSALPIRAYEAIYNSFYRDERNNPLIINGKEIYNTYIHNDRGGSDDTVISDMYLANWYPDAYTTAVQSPQQGLLPLVGITATGRMTFEDEDGKSYTLQANIADDGTLTGIESHSSDMPTGTLRAIVDTISTGISINDFRNVNALQRWLEKNLRRGLRYKDIVKSHFGNDIRYSEVDIPEFIGGISRTVDMNKVVQTSSDVDGSPLGTLAGLGNIFGDTDVYITHHCDEPGFIIGIISVIPEPVYSQRLDKQFTKQSLLDYYFPEFAHVGYQPIFNQEIAPLQTSSADGKKPLDVFGYQRAWHEYISAFDEVHGDFQNSLRNYLIQRVFGDVPQLSKQFLLVDQDIANEVFADRSDNAKIFGQIYFDFQVKVPIPKYGIPRLEA